MIPPTITVLMPLYNGARYLNEAVDSILNQSLSDFELLVIDDGSTDDGPEYITAYTDPRIRLERMPANQGIVAALNHGISLSRGRFIARMDADDIAHPERLARQLAAIENQPDVAALGSDFEPFGDGSTASWITYFDSENLRIALLFENPLCHPSVMLRKQSLEATGGYPTHSPHAEEYALWLQLNANSRLSNLPDRLLRYRMHAEQISRVKSAEQSKSIDRLIGAQLDALGLVAGSRDLRIHHALGGGFFPHPSLDRLLGCWVKTLIEANDRSLIYDPQTFAAQLVKRQDKSIERHRSILAAMSFHRRVWWKLSCWIALIRTPDNR